ncbi:MAG: GNAT family N-acetyltransferase [Jatrophihabitans sp.]
MSDVSIAIVEAEISRELRRSVLRPALPVGSPLPGDSDAGVRHLAAFVGQQLVSACLIFPEPCPWLPDRPAWRLRGMATDPAHRGTGAGAAILGAASEIAGNGGASILWCQARQTAIGFYARHGWRQTGTLFDTEIGPHLRMWFELGTGRSPRD